MTFLEAAALTVRPSVFRDVTVVILRAEERRASSHLQTPQVEFLATQPV